MEAFSNFLNGISSTGIHVFDKTIAFSKYVPLDLSIDNELFSEMSENEINELIRRKTLSLDKNNLTDDEITSEFSKLRNKLKMNESFKCFFTKKAHSNR